MIEPQKKLWKSLQRQKQVNEKNKKIRKYIDIATDFENTMTLQLT